MKGKVGAGRHPIPTVAAVGGVRYTVPVQNSAGLLQSAHLTAKKSRE